MRDDSARQVGAQVLARLGFAPTDLLQQRLDRVMQNRMQRLGYASVKEYLAFVEHASGDEELAQLAEALTINETYLFREPKHFEVLKQVLPELARTTDNVRILSAACSSGEEAHSIAITASRALSTLGRRFEVVGVDIDGNSLAKAREGSYGRWSFREEGLTFASGFVRPQGNRWLVVPRIRELVRFEQMNLVHANPPGPFHVVFCRNMLMYLTSENRQAVVNRLVRLLPPGGIWFLGSSETLDVVPPELERVAMNGTHYFRKREVVPPIGRRGASESGAAPRVIVVSKSPLFRVAMRQAVRSVGDIEIAAEVGDGKAAVARAADLGADLVVVDRLGDDDLLPPAGRSVPVLVVCTAATKPARSLGTYDAFVVEHGHPSAVRADSQALVQRILELTRRGRRSGGTGTLPRLPGTNPLVRSNGNEVARLNGPGSREPRGAGVPGSKAQRLLVIGSSTGGPAAVTSVLQSLPAGLGLCVLIVQHMPAGFTASFADRLHRTTEYAACEAFHGAPLVNDALYVAPGGKAMLVTAGSTVQIAPHDTEDIYVPNINRTFRSLISANLALRTIGIVMTGMGDDGAAGLAELGRSGGETIVQDPDEAVVPGMVKAAIDAGADRRILRLGEMTREIVRLAQARARARAEYGT